MYIDRCRILYFFISQLFYASKPIKKKRYKHICGPYPHRKSMTKSTYIDVQRGLGNPCECFLSLLGTTLLKKRLSSTYKCHRIIFANIMCHTLIKVLVVHKTFVMFFNRRCCQQSQLKRYSHKLAI